MPTVKVDSFTKQHRRTQLDGRIVVFVACGSDLNKIALYEAFAKEHGLIMVLVESPGNKLASRMHDSHIVNWIQVDLSPRASLVDDCITSLDAAFKEMGKDTSDISGVVTFWDDAVALTARLATYYNLATSPPEAIDISHDKFASRQALMNAGLPYPKNTLISNIDEIDDALKDLEFPLVLKPVQGATSIGVYVCTDRKSLTASLEDGIRVLHATYDANELMGLVFDDSPKDCTKNTNQLISFVLEEYIDGPEVDIDMVVSNGEVTYAKVSDDWETEEPWRTETGVNYPSRLPMHMHEEFISASTSVIKAFGISHGVLHVEMKYSSKHGPMLIEVNPRMGGGPCHFFHKELYDIDLAFEHVYIACGFHSIPEAKEPDHWGVGLLLYALESGVVSEDVDSTDEYRTCRQAKHVVDLSMPLKKGDELTGWNSPDFPTHAGLLMVKMPREGTQCETACDYARTLRHNCLQAIKYEA